MWQHVKGHKTGDILSCPEQCEQQELVHVEQQQSGDSGVFMVTIQGKHIGCFRRSNRHPIKGIIVSYVIIAASEPGMLRMMAPVFIGNATVFC